MSGQTILNNRYHLLTQYASGGMAVIYKVMDIALQRTVAAKILRPSLTQDPQFTARFQNEARAIANLSHPNIVTLHDVGMDVDSFGKQTHYIIMEFVEGQDLKKLIRAQGALNVDRALTIAIQICAGIGFAHRAGIVHADIKPQNILLNKDGVVKVTDFGIAQAWSDTQPTQKEAVVWGSPHYYAPEQARGDKPSAASDVYSIGIVIFEMLTGRVPYLGNNQQELALAHIREPVPLATDINPAVPQELGLIIQRAMAKEPRDRFRMADQLGQVLTSYRERGREHTANMGASPSGTGQKPVTSPSRPSQPQSMPDQPTTPPPPPSTLPNQPQSRPTMPTTLPQPPVQSSPAPPPPPASHMPPTQRYNVAPEAPAQAPYNRPQAGPYQPAGQQGGQPYQQGYGQQPVYQPSSPASVPYSRGDSGYNLPPAQYSLRGQSEPLQPVPSVLDSVTIALAVLAFISVACLIPLYILVFSALSGGGG